MASYQITPQNVVLTLHLSPDEADGLKRLARMGDKVTFLNKAAEDLAYRALEALEEACAQLPPLED